MARARVRHTQSLSVGVDHTLYIDGRKAKRYEECVGVPIAMLGLLSVGLLLATQCTYG